jgi:hypothetical protein
MASGGDDWLKRALALLGVMLGVSSAGTLISLSNSGQAKNVPAVAASTPRTMRVDDATNASGPRIPGTTRPFAMLREFLEPADTPMFTDGCAPPSSSDAITRLRAVADCRQVRIHFVIAIVPDWVDSSLQWTFDPMIDAIQMAAGQMDYVPSGFYLPDSDALARTVSTPASQGEHKTHELEPGAILFRRVNPEGNPPAATAPRQVAAPRPELLMVLLVGESAISGVHPRALAAAIDFAARWHPDGQNGPVRILGPSYSGSAMSLRTSLEAARQRAASHDSPGLQFDIVTPSASSPNNRDYLNVAGIASFRSTTRSDDEVLTALARFLGRTDRDWRCGKQVALLVEANTTWGRRFFKQGQGNQASVDSGAGSAATGSTLKDNACYRCTHGDPDDEFTTGAQPMPCAAVLSFPLHISRLRSEAAQASKAQSSIAVPSPATVSLPLNEPLASTDRMPSVTPILTAANVETMLGGVFQAINERHVTAVGVLATDKRDHLFLAEEIARRTPNVLPFTIESNLIYLHPDVSSYVRGTVVASTYSLNDRTQFLTRPTLANHLRHQFASSAAQGTYNALLALMGDTQQMLDYDNPAGPGQPVPALPEDGPCQPGHVTCRPPVWISVAARGSMVSLTSAPPVNGLETGYSLLVRNSAPFREARPQQDYIGAHGLFLALIAVIVALLGWHGRQVSKQKLEEQLSGHKLGSLNAERRAGRFAREGAVIALALWLTKLVFIHFADSNHVEMYKPHFIYITLAIFAGGVLLVRALQAFWTWPPRGWRPILGIVATTAFAALIVAWCLLANPGAREAASRAIVVMALVATFIDIEWKGYRAVLYDVTHLRRLPVLFGLGAVLCLLCHLATDFWSPADAVMYADRSGSLASLVSPAPIIVVLCGAVYWWGAWNLRRVQLMRLPEIEVGVGDLLKRRALRGGTRPTDVFEQPSLTVGAFILLPALLTVYALWVGAERVGSIDGRIFGGFLLLGAMCVLSITGHTLAHTLHLGNAILGTLRALGRHPAVGAFKTIGEDNFYWHMTFREVTVAELEPLVRRVERSVAGGQAWTSEDEGQLAEVEPPGARQWRAHAQSVLKSLQFEPMKDDTAELLRTSDWNHLHILTSDFNSILNRTRWRADFDSRGCSTEFLQTLEHMEYVVMFHGAVVLRHLLTRLVSGFTAILGGLLMMMLGHLLYTFQGRAFWLMLDWVTIGVTGLVGIRVLAGLDRDYVLSRLWKTTPGQLSVFGGLSWRMLAYLAIAIVAVFAAFFPEIWGGAGKWLDPIRKLIP